MTFTNTLRTAYRGMITNKLRATLTTLGIIIGVASVIVMLALGNGARAAVEANFRNLGADVIQIYEAKELKQGEFTSIGKTLTYEDGLNLAKDIPYIKYVDMMVNGSGKARHERSALDTSIEGVTAAGLQILTDSGTLQPVNWPVDKPLTASSFLAEGRFFTPSEVMESAGVCVLGSKTALDLFEGEDPLNQSLWINRQPCMVIGVFKELETTDPQQRYQDDPNYSFYLPISTAVQNLFETEPSVFITAHIKDQSQMDAAKAMITTYLRKRHSIVADSNGKITDDFAMNTRSDVLGAQQEAARTFSLLLAAMAAVSLVVGGIGIMNVMLVTVSERTREIGIRMAIGAKQKDIVLQFLLEAMLISIAGGLCGVVLGVFAIPLAASLNQGIALLAPNSIPLALAVALFTGIAFGIYPALRAARLNPIEALRYE